MSDLFLFLYTYTLGVGKKLQRQEAALTAAVGGTIVKESMLRKFICNCASMKKVFLISALTFVVIVTAGCNWRARLGLEPSTAVDQEEKQVQTYLLKSASSTLNWKITKVRGFSGEGAMKLASGTFTTEESGVTGGSFALDTASLVKNGGNTLAADHFKVDAYLNAAKYVAVTFTIDEIHSVDVRAAAPTAYEVTGTLRASFWSKQITFPITFVEKNGELVGDATISTTAGTQAGRTELPAEAKTWLGTGNADVVLHLVAVKQ